MEYYLNRVNVILIALVSGLCLWQWSGERKADSLIEDLRRVVAANERHLVAQDQAIHGANEDIDEFKRIIAQFKSRSDASDIEIKREKAGVFALEQKEKRRVAEAEAAAKERAAYKEGIAARDADIRLLLGQRQQLIAADQDAVRKADQAVTAYNDLAGKYTGLIGQYNELARRYKAEHAPAPAPDAAARPSS